MDQIRNLLRFIPFLQHLNHDEAEFFIKSGTMAQVKKGQVVDIKKTNSLNIVIEGFFEIESIANRDIVYLSSGSFFGFLPFIENRKKGNVKALADSRLFVIGEDELYRLFMMSHKALRGYIKSIENLNFEMSDTGRKYFDHKGKVVTVYSRVAGAGKTFLSSVLGLSLSGEKTMILDLSYSGKSVFDLFQQKMPVPLSERDRSEKTAESLINDRIVRVNENLHLLNVAFSSRVRVDPAILGPLLFILSKEYRYIIADLSEGDDDLRDAVFNHTDFIFSISGNAKEMENVEGIFDRTLKEGQRVYYVRNNHLSKEKGPFYGGIILERCEGYNDESGVEILESYVSDGNAGKFKDLITARNRALVMQSAQLDSVLMASLVLELNRNQNKFEYIYSSSFTYFLTGLYLLFDDQETLSRQMRRFFSPEQFNRIFEITFPEKHLFRSAKALRYAGELAGSKRVEMFESLPVAAVVSDGVPRMYSTGSLSSLMASSLLSEPLAEPVKVNGSECSSGYPGVSAHPSHLLRTEADEIFNIAFVNSEKLSVEDERYNRFIIRNLESAENRKVYNPDYTEQNKKLLLEVSENEFKFDKIVERTSKLSRSLIVKVY